MATTDTKDGRERWPAPVREKITKREAARRAAEMLALPKRPFWEKEKAELTEAGEPVSARRPLTNRQLGALAAKCTRLEAALTEARAKLKEARSAQIASRKAARYRDMTERQARVLKARHEGKTFREIGELEGCSPARAREIFDTAERKARHLGSAPIAQPTRQDQSA